MRREMFLAEDLRDWRGKKVIDPEGHKIGTLEAVYSDTASDEPVFVTVKVTKLSGALRLAFVPTAAATVSPSAVRVSHPKKLVRDAPSIELDAELTSDEEPSVFEYYQLDYMPGLSGERRLARG